MKRLIVWCVAALAVQLAPGAFAQQFPFSAPGLTYNPGSSVRVEQITGVCDWTVWDATITTNASDKIVNPDPVCTPTVSQTITRFNVLGHDLGSNFEHNGQTIFLFGDTIGASSQYNPQWSLLNNPFPYMAWDTFAFSNTSHGQTLRIFYTMSTWNPYAVVLMESDFHISL